MPRALQGVLPGATWAPRELSGDSLGPPQTHEKPMKSVRKTKFSEKLTLERFPRAQEGPESHFGTVLTPRPTLPLYLLDGTIKLHCSIITCK